MTSHSDLPPTLLEMTHASAQKKAAITKGHLGKDITPLLAAPEQPTTAPFAMAHCSISICSSRSMETY